MILEFLAFEDGFGVGDPFVVVLRDFGAAGVGDWVYAELGFVDELEEGLQQGSCQVLLPYFFTHNIIRCFINLSFLFLFLLGPRRLFLHPDDLFLLL